MANTAGDIFFNQTNNDGKRKTDYSTMLKFVQQKITQNYTSVLAEKNTEEAIVLQKGLILKIITEEKYCYKDYTREQLVEKIYNDMSGSSFLERWIFQEKGVEEININRWDDITITLSGKKPIKLEDKFANKEQAIDVIKRLLLKQGQTLDATKPSILSYLGEGVRISCDIAPVVSEDAAVNASIRIVKPDTVSEDNFIKFGTLTKEMMDFLKVAIKCKTSVCVSGETGSGKTTLLSFLLTTVNDEERIVTIEEGSREFSLVKRDENGNVINNVVSLLTRDSDDPNYRITQEFLLERCMRKNPSYLGIGEMRSSEAYTGAEAARTGTTALTTTHANDGPSTYKRLMELAYKKYPMDLDFLLQQMIDSFPLIVYVEKFPDGSRKVLEIIEGESVSHGKVKYRTLWKYVVEDNIIDENGKITKVIGHHERVDDFSNKLKDHFIRKGLTYKELNNIELTSDKEDIND